MSNKAVTTTTTSTTTTSTTTTIKMPTKHVSAPFDGPPKSTEQQLAEALAENEKFRETVNRLVDTHNAQKDEIEALKKAAASQAAHERVVSGLLSKALLDKKSLKLVINALKEEIEALKKENEKLKKDHTHIANLYEKVDVFEKLDVLCQYNEKTNPTRDLTMYESPPNEMAMYFSGMQDLVEHLCYNDDIITDSWIEHYNKGGLEGVKKELRRDSRLVHKNVACEECDRLIAGIHDQV